VRRQSVCWVVSTVSAAHWPRVGSNRWLLWLGLAFVLAVYFAPSGIVGALKADEAKTN
jgi:ABC-type branched-subunit amino acid transport system permease subunit